MRFTDLPIRQARENGVSGNILKILDSRLRGNDGRQVQNRSSTT